VWNVFYYYYCYCYCDCYCDCFCYGWCCHDVSGKMKATKEEQEHAVVDDDDIHRQLVDTARHDTVRQADRLVADDDGVVVDVVVVDVVVDHPSCWHLPPSRMIAVVVATRKETRRPRCVLLALSGPPHQP
jgi:hypothetical protein